MHLKNVKVNDKSMFACLILLLAVEYQKIG